MLRRVRRGPVAGQKEDEDHCSEKRIPEPEAAPDPERKDGASGGNQRLDCVRLGRIGSATEKSGLHSNTKKTNRAHGKRFFDPIPIEVGSGSSDFGGDIAKGS